MKKQRWTLTLLLAAGAWRAAGQSTVDLTRQGKLGTGIVLPATCTVGQMFLKTNAPAGTNLYACTSPPSGWTVMGLPALGGDATGTQQSVTVKGIQGRGVSAAAPADQNVLSWNAAAGQWEPGTSGMSQSSQYANPTVGSPSDLTSLLWTVGHDDVASTPGWSDADGWSLRFKPSYGQNDWNNDSKRTFNGLKVNLSSWAAGQREGITSQVYGQGVGDIAGFSCIAVWGSQNAAGDEGTNCYRGELADDTQATTVTLGTLPTQTTCGTGATITQSVTKDTAPQTVTVSSSSGCNVGDRVIVARQAISTTSTEEMILLTGVSSGHITAKFVHDHVSGATLSPATKLRVGDAWPLGQFRWLRRVGHDYTAGSVTAASGTMTGSGTSWTSTTFGGDAIAPGMFSLDSDTNTSQASGLRAWYWVCQIIDGTHLMVSDGLGCGGYYGLAVVPSNYKASCGGIVMGTDPPTAPGVVGPFVYLDTPPGVCGWTAGDTAEMTVAVRNAQVAYSAVLRSYAMAGLGTGGGFAVTNIGDVKKGAAFSLSAPGFVYSNPTKPAYEFALHANAVVKTGIKFEYGITNEMLGVTTFTGYGAPISWGASTGSGNAVIGPDTSNGNLQLFSGSAKLYVGSTSDGNKRYTLDGSGVTLNRTLVIPDKDGTLLTAGDVPTVTVSRTIPSTAASTVMIGSFKGNNASLPRNFDVYVQADGTAKRYTFSQSQESATAYQWAKVIPIAEELHGSNVWDLEYGGDSNLAEMRLRNISGGSTVDATITVYCYANTTGGCGFTPSTTTGTSGSYGVNMASTVVEQIGGVAKINGKLALGSVPAYTCNSGAAGQINYIAGGPGVKDIVQVCVKNASDVWAWVAIY